MGSRHSSASNAHRPRRITASSLFAPSAPQTFSSTVTGRLVTLAWAALATGSGPLSYAIERQPFFVRVRAQNACGISGASEKRTIVVP
jgi:hypothetical protein